MLYGSIEVAKKVGISLRQLYYWVDSAKVITPQVRQYGMRAFKRYTQEDIAKLQKMRRFLEEGFTLQAAVKFVKKEETKGES